MELPMLGEFGRSFFGNNLRVESYRKTILSKLIQNGSLSLCSLFRKPHNPRKKIIYKIEETFQGNTVIQSIEDETKVQDFFLRVARG